MRLAALVSLLALVAGSVALSTALADPASIDVRTGFFCGTQDASGNAIFTTQSSFIWYASGKATLHCVAQGPASGSIVVWDFSTTGNYCFFGFDEVPPTTDWSDRVGRLGGADLWCYGFEAPPTPPVLSVQPGVTPGTAG
jgi:hypothetical protein